VAPPYSAVMACVPLASEGTVSVTTPPVSEPVPRVVPSSRNVTEPVGVPAVSEAVTVAVNVTG
jgi:cobalamin biosynthesis protein CbiG